MDERQVGAELLLRVTDEGQTRYSDAQRLWAWLAAAGCDVKFIWAAPALEDTVIVKTVMHHWEPMP